jgi:hypothetical protein
MHPAQPPDQVANRAASSTQLLDERQVQDESAVAADGFARIEWGVTQSEVNSTAAAPPSKSASMSMATYSRHDNLMSCQSRTMTFPPHVAVASVKCVQYVYCATFSEFVPAMLSPHPTVSSKPRTGHDAKWAPGKHHSTLRNSDDMSVKSRPYFEAIKASLGALYTFASVQTRSPLTGQGGGSLIPRRLAVPSTRWSPSRILQISSYEML